ncbi:MAG: PAS domain-containing sensor histidine kinase [Flammeovirgaceae bacterium]|nr:PAS domain-containing sensor histidine kinase [Flammeovirgaceae bacterium]|tara:strand:+ start:7834 stop:9144 length:1311 start_codon:yes stop_codon:yes gene_type:complete
MELSSEYLMSRSGLELLNKIFLSAGEGIIIVNSQGEIVMANKRSEELFGYNEAELLGKVIENLIPKEYHHKHVKDRQGYVDHPKSRPMGIGKDLVGLKKDGSTFPLEVSLSFITHQNQKLVVAFITDISTRKQQEAALAESRTKLEQYAHDLETKVRERTKELEHLNLGLKSQIRERKLAEAALKESLEEVKKAETEILKALEKEKELNELKSRFISMASHEFRTPLTTILSSANLIGRYPEGDDQEKRVKHINRIRNSVQNLTNILNDFLSLEKLESGAISLKIVQFSLKEIYDEIMEAMELSLKPGQDLHTEFDDNLTQIISDQHLIKNISLNLLSNAIKYSPENANIEFSIKEVEDSVIQIRVKDEGIGIPKKEQSKLFQRFYRAENATNIQGTGLGLNIVKRYLDLLKGEISFTSKEGLGTEFIVNFPYRKP